MPAPNAQKIPHIHEIHGDKRSDDYFWMRKRDSAEVLDHLKAENAYCDEALAPLKSLKEEIFEEMKGRIKKDDSSVPYFKRGYYYYVRYESEQEYPIYCRKKDSLDAAEEIILDVNELAEGKSYYDLAVTSVSPDNKLLAFAVDTEGRRKYTIHFKSLADGKILDVEIPNVTPNFRWASDSSYVFYTQQNPETLRAESVFRFSMTSHDSELVFHESDELFGCFVTKSLSEEYLFIYVESKITSEIHYLKATDPTGEWKVFEPRKKGHEYSLEHGGDDLFYVLSNDNGAENFKLMEARLSQPGIENWTEVLPHDPKIFRNDLEVFKNHIVVGERSDGLTQLRVLDRKTKKSELLSFPETAYVCAISINANYDTETLRYSYSSPKTPPSVYDFHFESKKHTLLKQQEVLGDFNRDDYEVERVFATSKDGTKVPMSLVYKKGLNKDGRNPCLQYGYGSYGICTEPGFNDSRLSLLDRGFVWAITHIRGGSEMGRPWYEDGKFLKKQNTFDDFIACSEFLIKEGYTSASKLAIFGGSAGGLLVGQVMNLRPDLYQAVIAAVPFVDVVTTMLDETLPLTIGEYEEWGNPNDPTYYNYMKSYSPYDNVEAKDYPHLLVTTGYHDSQVQYWEPAKWVAKLRETSTSKNLIVFKTDMEAGHGGTTGRFKSLEERALDFAFAVYTTTQLS